ncbi:MAG: hypothetical protein GF364_07810 [Candidatus Lokiarchaeota archaeon]|nr:hypothetical protein [Candidatus Lokiarchaeota archaeon]
MKKHKKVIRIGILLLFISFILFSSAFTPIKENKNHYSIPTVLCSNENEPLTNNDIIEHMFTEYIDQYNEYGYFPSYYIPSLQGTYYALSILNTLNRMDSLNQTQLVEFVMDHYNTSTGIFIDDYALRYLDTDFNIKYYPLSSVLQVNAYAVLSLHLLGRVYLIDFQKMIDFIWQCYNPISGGFAGRRYDPGLSNYTKAATLDNTYFAILTLELLLDSWNNYESEKSAIIDFIINSQELNPQNDDYGGFDNAPHTHYYYLYFLDPNIHASYYALKVLELFNSTNSIDIPAFHCYLSFLYHSDSHYFHVGQFQSFERQSVFPSTAMGGELSILTGYTGINETKCIEYILSHRNEGGIWDINDYYGCYELIDTFQVIRSLCESWDMRGLNSSKRDQIAASMDLFRSYRGYSFTSREYTKVSQLYSLAESFRLYNKVGDLELLEIYDLFEGAYLEETEEKTRIFRGYLNTNGVYGKFRLTPIEFENYGTLEHTNYIDPLSSHKWSYKALIALDKLYKLDDFDNYHNLTKLLHSAEACQILDPDSDQFGGFLPSEFMKHYNLEFQERYVQFDHTYYALKTIDFLADWLGLGTIFNTSVDPWALVVYLFPDTIETPEVMYYKADYDTGEDIELRLKHTFYLADIYHMLNYTHLLNPQRIRAFVLESINYSNLENLYYCFKLDELLSLDIDYNLDLAHRLIKDIYDPLHHEIYLTPKHLEINPNSFYWMCYMAQYDDYKINVDYPSEVQMTSQFNFSTRVSNVVLDTIISSQTLKFESNILGIHTLEDRGDGIFEFEAEIPLNPNLYPTVEGSLNLYEGPNVIFSRPISFNTSYDLLYEVKVINRIRKQDFIILANFSTPTGYYDLDNGELRISTYVNGTHLRNLEIENIKCGTYSNFTKTMSLNGYGEYLFEIYLSDGINRSTHQIGTHRFNYFPFPRTPPAPPPEPSKTPNPIKIPGYLFSLLGLGLIGLISVSLLRWDKRRRDERREDEGKKGQIKEEVEKTEVTYNVLVKEQENETLWDKQQKKTT